MGGRKAAGFTLVEMTVVMAIIAVLALIGISVLQNLKNGPKLDDATQNLLTTIREAQNKSISVASAPSGSIPIVWGVEINNNSVQTLCLQGTGSICSSLPAAVDYSPISVSVSSGVKRLYFTAPFGKFYAASTAPSSWTPRAEKPKDAIPASLGTPSGDTTITLSYKGSQKTITITPNGDVYAQ